MSTNKFQTGSLVILILICSAFSGLLITTATYLYTDPNLSNRCPPLKNISLNCAAILAPFDDCPPGGISSVDPKYTGPVYARGLPLAYARQSTEDSVCQVAHTENIVTLHEKKVYPAAYIFDWAFWTLSSLGAIGLAKAAWSALNQRKQPRKITKRVSTGK